MKPLRFILTVVVGCGALAARADAMASDCQSNTPVGHGFTRVFIGLGKGTDGSGKTSADARDGGTVDKFDRILRCYAEGCSDPATHRNTVKTDNLIVCLGPGTYQTRGTYDFVINTAHKTDKGFTLGKGWKVHGAGEESTIVQLAEYLPIRTEPNPASLPVNTGVGAVFSTYSDDASNIEVSDLTVDDNYPALKESASRAGIRALNLQAIQLRSSAGRNWIHDVNVINTAGEIGLIDIRFETFPVWIYSVHANSSPGDNSGNIIERVTMSKYGGGKCTAIAVANAIAEVRENRVEGYQIAYGGWIMGPVWFHDNVAVETDYGFNIDSLVNKGVRIERNQILHPRLYGVVVGGGGTYDGFLIRGNTVKIDRPGVIALVFEGNVTNAVVAENSFLAEDPSTRATAIRSFSNGRTGPNHNNSYQGNKIGEKLRITFSDRKTQDNCMSGNRDERGRPLRDMPDNHAGPCMAAPSDARPGAAMVNRAVDADAPRVTK
jgi:hypothetical protein